MTEPRTWLSRALDEHVPNVPSKLHSDAAWVVEQFPNTSIAELARRGLVHWFDLEGNFFEEGEHAKTIRGMLASCGVSAEVRDQWVPGEGFRLWVEANGKTTQFFCEVDGAEDMPSDWGEVDLMITAVETVSGWRVALLNTGDQTVCFVCAPPALYAGMLENGVLEEIDEEEFGEEAEEDEAPELMRVMPRPERTRTTRVVQ
jgi:hypothetical protein